jgi:DNA-binding PadR family transcriptional regulator
MPESSERGALTEAVFYILLALHKPMHGYGIMQFVSEMSGGRVALGPGTLYGAISTLMEKRWICAVPGIDARKKGYVITGAGREAVKNEIARLKELLKNGRAVLREEEQ